MMTSINLRSASQHQGRPYRLVDICNLFLGLTIALFSYMLVCTQTAEALELRCDDANVVVHSPNLGDAKSVCKGAADAIRFLGAQGFETNGQIEVLIVADRHDLISDSAYGGYIHSVRSACVVVFSEIAKHGTLFDLPFDRDLYRSLATHEVAHAIAALNFRISEPQIEAEEYIAYVAMYATMPAMYRDKLLERFVGMEFENEMQINTIVYLLDSFRFGILAYKHFMKASNGADFLQQVLMGRALLELEYAY